MDPLGILFSLRRLAVTDERNLQNSSEHFSDRCSTFKVCFALIDDHLDTSLKKQNSI